MHRNNNAMQAIENVTIVDLESVDISLFIRVFFILLKNGVVKLQPLELFDKNNLTQNNTVSNIYQRIVLVMKESTQEYYNMRMALGLKESS